MKAVIVGNIEKPNRDLNGINLIKGVRFAHPFFYCLQVKNAYVYKPPAGLTDKQRLSSELDKILSCDILRILKIKRRNIPCIA
jgi:hypothetical protein